MVAPLPGWLIDQARQTQRVRFDRTCQVLRKVKTNDGAGGATTVEAVVATYGCSIGPLSSRTAERLTARGIVVTTADQVATLEYGAAVLLTDRLGISGSTYDVIDVAREYTGQTAVQVVIRG